MHFRAKRWLINVQCISRAKRRVAHHVCNDIELQLCQYVEADTNMNTELLDDVLDEIFEESDSEDYNENESEIEELEPEVSEDTEKCADDGD
ncbi:hypothetical protein AVEN_86454-1 [Araneus ventricosus]|uniref:Uncharacterized protein n=1 Tax=Araneus ventricosus TaxID=182803 RepID=A0A4Y2G1Z9_ARAVE|nr:hypothetical protein AVEN_86454-1 [Araneus ventricosus]